MTSISFHSRQPSLASSFAPANGLGIHNGTPPIKSHPQYIGPWRLGKTLGRGSTGRVLLATHTSTGQKAAVKVVNKSNLNEESRELNEKGCDSVGLPYGIEREIIIMKLLNHQNVLRLYDVWETSKALYLVLEFVEGGELFDLLVESGPLLEKDAVKFFRQIIAGASYCHALGICHRDLKPENLLLNKDLSIKIADFGMAALEANGRLLETSCGSPHYASPEIVSGLKYQGSASDVWSCGVILFALLTGRLPFDDENIRNLLLKVQKGAFEMPSSLSPEAQNLIAQMLKLAPEERIKTQDILKHPLLLKYPCTEMEQHAMERLPSPDLSIKPVSCREDIDDKILQNLTILWHGRPAEQIIQSLLVENEQNPEKTFYSLLLHYRHDHQDKDLSQSLSMANSINKVIPSPNSQPSSASLSRLSSLTPMRKAPSKPNQLPPLPALPKHVAEKKSSHSPKANKRSSMISVTSKRLSMLSLNSKRSSLFFSNTSSTGSSSPIKGKKASNSPNKRKSAMKRNSITSRIISTYAKLASEPQYDYMERSTRRTSSNFATLCERIFSGEDVDFNEFLQEEELELKSQKKSRKRQSLLSAKRQSVLVTKVENEDGEVLSTDIRYQPVRAVSSPQKKRDSYLLNKDDIEDIKRRSMSLQVNSKRSKDKQIPPRPVSRLDPRYQVYENYKRTSQDAAKELEVPDSQGKKKEETEPQQDLKKSLPSIPQVSQSQTAPESDDYLKSSDASLHVANEFLDEMRQSRLLTSKFDLNSIISKQATEKNKNYRESAVIDGAQTRLSDIKIPQVTRKSRHFSNSNKRLSVLSVYSTKSSYRDLNAKMQDRQNVTSSTSAFTNKRSTRNSLIFKEDDEIDMSIDISAQKANNDFDQTYGQAVDENLANTDINGRRVEELEKEEERDQIGEIMDNKPNLHYKPSKDTLISQDSNKDYYKKLSLPDIPSSPVKKELSFEIHDDTQKDKSGEQKQRAASEKVQPIKQHKANDGSITRNKSEPTRRVLNDVSNDETLDIPKQRKKSSFLRKISFGSKQVEESGESQPQQRRRFSDWFRSTSNGDTQELSFIKSKLKRPDMFEALNSLLIGWKQYGVKDITLSRYDSKIIAAVSKHNSTGLKACRFQIVIKELIDRSKGVRSELVIKKVKGSSKTLKQIVSQIEKVLEQESVLVK
ncbi:hypothetical protein LJB42_000114 [Komagataella kurtzmanii]|nr:hypothetical protein LJB42_000114 [Komagataella kurtzmanii]